MDTQTALMSTTTGGTALTIFYFLYRTFMGKRCRSSCCGHDLEMGIMVETMSAPIHTGESKENASSTFQMNNPILPK
jgi:hypothetical protein